MSESLSQSEIDALFSGGGQESAAPSAVAEPEGPEIQPYDFGRPARISKDRKRSLLAIFEVLSKSLEGWLMGRCRDPVEIEIESVEALTFGEFTLALRSPCVGYVVDVNGSNGHQGVIEFGPDLAFTLVDRLLGGGSAVSVPDRSLTPLERLVVRIVAEKVSAQLVDAWKDYIRLEVEVTGFESMPEMIQIANREDPVLVAHLQVHVGDRDSTLLICLPFPVLEKFFTGDSSRRTAGVGGTEEERRQDRARITSSLLAAGIDVAARLPSFPVSMERLAGLQVGSTLLTGIVPEAELEVLVDGQPRFVGSAGRAGQQIAVRITDLLPGDARTPHPRSRET